MSEKVQQVEKEILEKIKTIRDQYQIIIGKMGQLELQIIDTRTILNDLNSAKDKLIIEYNEIKKQESDIMDNLNKKYGQGNIDLSNGTFTSEK